MKNLFLFALLCIAFSVSAQEVVSLSLIDANSDAVIRNLEKQDTIYFFETGSSLNIRANTSGTVGSVSFGYDGAANYQIESVAPYAFAGDNSGDYNSWTPAEGQHVLTATPFSGTGATGTAGATYSVNLVVDAETTFPQVPMVPPTDPGTGEMSLTGELMKWHKITLSFDGPPHSETDQHPNPFLDYRLNVKFKNGNHTYIVPGYFAADGAAGETSADSGNVWRVHFTPDQIGEWNWEVSFRFGDQVAVSLDTLAGEALTPLDGQTGSFIVDATDKSGEDLRANGRLEYVGAHHLRFAETGAYFLKGGSDAPENLLAYEDFDNTPNNGGRLKSWSAHQTDWNDGDPDWQSGKGTELIGAINYLASEGLNSFSFLTMNINGDDKNVYPYVSASNFKHFDCSKLDQWGFIFDHAMTKGMYLHFKTQETENETLLDGGRVDTERKMYYRELVARFGYHLALNWNLGEENSDQTTTQRIEMAQYFYDIDPYHHNIVIHTYPNAHEEIYTPLLWHDSKITGASIQTDWNNVHRNTKKWVALSASTGKKWVVANDEQGSANIGVPEDGYTGSPSLDDIRKQVLWGNIMGGGAGVEYYFGYSRPQSDLSCEDFRSRNKSWDYVRYALEFFRNNQVPFWQMHFDDNLVDNGWCLADTGNIYLVYLPDGGSAQLRLQNSKNYTVQWYDPGNGGELKNGSIASISGPGTQSLGSPPDNPGADWVVLIRNISGVNLAPVGLAEADTLSGKAPFQVSLNASGSYDEDGEIVEWKWDYGNGETESGEQAEYVFDKSGNYLVKLTVTDDKGAKGTDVLNISVGGEGVGAECNGQYTEQNGLLVVEIESEEPAAGWQHETSTSGYTGDGYYRWNGNNNFNNPGVGILNYSIFITHPGTYRFKWHSKIMHGTDPTESNDSWLRIPDADDFFGVKNGVVKYPKGGMFVQSDIIVNGSSKDGWMKVFSSGTTNWTWTTSTSDNEAYQIYATFYKPGIYTVQVSARSKNHAVDRFVLYDESKFTQSEATRLSNEETTCGTGRPQPEYQVSFKVDHEGTTLESANVTFNGNTRTTNDDGVVTFAGVKTTLGATYTIARDCFETKTGSIDVTGNMEYSVSLDSADCPPVYIFEIVLLLDNRSDGDLVTGAEVVLSDQVQTSNSSGTASFTMEVEGSMNYRISHAEFFTEEGSFDISSDTIIEFHLSPKKADIQLLVSDGTNPVSDVIIKLGTQSRIADAEGDAVFPMLVTRLEYSIEISHDTYEIFYDTVYLEIDTTINITLIPTGISPASSSIPIKLYPNPTKEKIHILTGTPEASIQLFSPLGSLVLEEEFYSPETEVDLGNYPAGLYVLRVQTREHTLIEQVIKE